MILDLNKSYNKSRTPRFLIYFSSSSLYYSSISSSSPPLHLPQCPPPPIHLPSLILLLLLLLLLLILPPSVSQDSLVVINNAKVDKYLSKSKVYDKYQFERCGFFSVDPDSKDNKVTIDVELSINNSIYTNI